MIITKKEITSFEASILGWNKYRITTLTLSGCVYVAIIVKLPNHPALITKYYTTKAEANNEAMNIIKNCLRNERRVINEVN